MTKKINTQLKRAEQRIQLRNWILKGDSILTGKEPPSFIIIKSPDGLAYYRETESKQIVILERSDLVAEIAVASSEISEAQDIPEISMTYENAKDCMNIIEGFIKLQGCDKIIEEEIKPIGFVDDEGFCFRRIPLSRAGVTPSEERLKEKREWSDLGPFMNSLRTNMLDYDTDDSRMFRRLLSAVGALLWDSEPRREILYWHGMGGEGKTTFCNFLAHKLGSCALPNIKPKKLTEDYTIAMLEGKRLVIAEEAGKGRFLTEEMKAITGNRYLTGRAPYKGIRSFRNHTFFWMTSNQMPIIDGEDSSTGRLRLICSTPRKDGTHRTEQDIYAELELYWPHIVDAAVLEYFAAGKSILSMTGQEIEEPVSNYHLDADGWIDENFEYAKGSFVPNKLIKRMLKNERISLSDVKSRLSILNPEDCEEKINVQSRQRLEDSRQERGVLNIRLKQDSSNWTKNGWSACKKIIDL
jgi:hypothetical protein